MNNAFQRYLAAKRTVDDRALNAQVWEALAQHEAAAPATRRRVLELGAGTGSMVERLLEKRVLNQADYTALDAQAENTAEASQRLPAWGADHNFQVDRVSPGELCFNRPGQQINLRLITADALEFAAQPAQQQAWDLLVAHAFLDLLDLPSSLPGLFRLLRPGGHFYFSVNFDGLTLFEPAIDPVLDSEVEAAYHRTMDERLTNGRPSGDSRSGRHLFSLIPQAGGQILAAGASDWVVFAGPQGYPADEAYFLGFILDTLERTLQGRPELNQARFQAWMAQRRGQLARCELVYVAHQLDFFGRLQA